MLFSPFHFILTFKMDVVFQCFNRRALLNNICNYNITKQANVTIIIRPHVLFFHISVLQKMAEMGHTVCVRGLPSDMEHERLEDKLLIHFLRERHGGGEISSISIKATDPCAIITFEDSRGLSLFLCKKSVLE